MFRRLIKPLKTEWIKRHRRRDEARKREIETIDDYELSADLDRNLAVLRQVFDRCSDFIVREFVAGQKLARCALIYFDGLVTRTSVETSILKTLLVEIRKVEPAPDITERNVFELIKEAAVSVGEVHEVSGFPGMLEKLLAGDAVLLVDGQAKVLVLGVRGWESRAVEEPETEAVVRGPREGFVETLRTNTSLIRRRIKSPRLKIETIKIGELTKTDVAVIYIEGLVNPQIVEEVHRRLKRIETDGIVDSGYIEEFIEDDPFSPFPQIEHSERPDKVTAALLEGRVVILADGSPFALVVPTVFVQFLQASEDYYERFYLASVVRLGRLVAVNVALLLPSAYVAITTFHQEMLPRTLLISIAAQREGVPFPAFVEALIMELTFEMLREAGIRLPRPVGQAISIVGALVIGEAAVSAGIVSPVMVVVVALTAIANFSIPAFNMAITLRLIRFIMLVLAAAFGFFGIMMGLVVILIHLCNLRSFGIPYLSPIAPFTPRDLKDVLVRPPWWGMFLRPRLIGYRNPQRQAFRLKPEPPKKRN
ncbi:spore germination protein [Calderihabitans maritimus]|uniref:L-lactate dehydrogenase (FMN-dependent) and related alpha-hydroxy acid dehydrogenases n=1 Tax=Calderihabitans maritimus TaxID=1246530 RepID=A0A1Z5HSL4_9FIRM|nr:spore germination protein [Calderihabitans maritimus]GAW92418.1 L-lactate dehydrogenase (FMN-dependent) and related alpha-hydroxy acid dehydrogenases [Calderihabitans maritimus]